MVSLSMTIKSASNSPESVAQLSRRVAEIYTALSLLRHTVKPPTFNEEQGLTSDVVYHGIPGSASLHIGRATPENTPLALQKRKDFAAKFTLWLNRHQKNGIVSTVYYFGENTADESTTQILTPKDDKRFRTIEPGQDSRRWDDLANAIHSLDDLPQPQPVAVETADDSSAA